MSIQRKVAAAVLGACMVLGASVGSVAAMGKPAPTFEFTACWTGDTVLMTVSWSGASVDAFDFGFSDGVGGGGFSQPLGHPTRTGTVTSIGADYALQPDIDTSLWMAGGLTYRGRVVFSDMVDKPAGGWNTLAACP